MKNSRRFMALFISVILIITMTVVPLSVNASSDKIAETVKKTFESYVLQNGNEVTLEGMKTAIEKAVGSEKKVTVREKNFYIKYAVDGVVDEDANPETRIDIAGSDGAVSAIIKVETKTYGLTASIKHKVENLGELTVANLGDYDGPDGTRIINWIGNSDPNKKYKVVLPKNTSHINTNGITFEGENADNIVALVILGHQNKYGYEPPRYGKFNNLRAVVMADTITDFPVEYAFSECRQLKYAHLSERLSSSIPIAMFKNCVSLENVNIPSGIKRIIDIEAFYGTALREIIYPDITILRDAFAAPAFKVGKRNLIVTGSDMSYPQMAAYSCAAVSQMKYSGETTKDDIENVAKSVWTNKNFNVDWLSQWDSDVSDGVIGGTLHLSKGLGLSYDIDFIGYLYDQELYAAVDKYVSEKGNGVTAENLLESVRSQLSECKADIELSQYDFYIKHAINGVVDEDPNQETRINIEGVDGAVAAIFEIGGRRVGVTATIKHTVENLGLLTIPNLGDYEDPDNAEKRIINWIGNGSKDKKYKLVLPKNTSFINTDGLTCESGNSDNIVAIVMLGHNEKLPRYNNFKNLEVVVMSDNITGAQTYIDNGYEVHLSQLFAGLSKLKYVHMSEKWNSIIPWGMFKDCTLLETLNLPKKIDGWIEGYAFAGTALREIEYPNVGVQENAFADPSFPEGESGRNVSVVDSDMRFIKAAAYAQVYALYTEFDSDTAKETVAQNILGGVIYKGNMNPDWNDTFKFAVGDETVSGVLTIIGPRKDTVPISYSKLLSQECGLESLSVKYFELTPVFRTDILEYTLELPNSVNSLKVTADVIHPYARVGKISGTDNIPTGDSEIIIPVIAQNGKRVEYKIKLNRSSIVDRNDTPENRFKNANDVLKVTNDTDREQLLILFENIVRDSDYQIEITDFYKLNAIEGTKDIDGVIVPAYNGYLAACVQLNKKGETVKTETTVLKTIEGYLKEFSFTSVSTQDDFELSDDGLTLMGYYGSAEKVVIPEGVESIDELWMVGNPSAIKALVIPETVRSLPRELCWGMSNLRMCYMGDQVTETSGSTFSNCNKLEYVHISEQLEELGTQMFQRTFALSDIHIPLSVNTVRNMAFFNGFIRDITLSGNVKNIWEDSFSWLSYNPDFFHGGNSWGVTIPLEDIAEIKEMISDKLDREVSINVVNPNLKYCSNLSTYQTDGTGAWSDITLYSPKDSTTYKHITEHGDNGVYHKDIDMSIAESVVRTMRYIDTMYVDNETSIYDFERAALNAYYSTSVLTEYTWAENFELVKATKTSKGTAKGVLVLKDKNGKEFQITVDREFSLAPELKSKSQINTGFDPNKFSDSFVNFFDSVTSIPDDVESDSLKESDDDTGDANGNNTKRKKRKVIVTYTLEPWVIPVITIGAIVGVVGITLLVIIIVKKRRKKKATLTDTDVTEGDT